MQIRPYRLSQLEMGDFTLAGYSVAGEESVIIAPELDCVFDIGKCPREALTVNHVLLSHGHMDHAAGLAYYFSQRTFQELRRKCRETFGVEPYIGVNQHVYGPDMEGGWNGKQPGGGRVDISSTAGNVDYDVAWWGAMAGPQIYPKAIALGPGHWCPHQTGMKPTTAMSAAVTSALDMAVVGPTRTGTCGAGTRCSPTRTTSSGSY